ncbi:MAG: hypothetical protein ABFS22_09535 [Pseudomonadota bacterium]
MAEILHQQARKQERKFGDFKSAKQAQLFLSVHGAIDSHFNLQHHLLPARNYRMFCDQAINEWLLVMFILNPA